ncbi:hypothetical protein [Streptomyces sp. NPDC059566]|uniref:hypothetical protein n=1 Tax=unclassified Streptomyces TaxID=2593676 RepID=UPI0036C5A032
MLEGARVTRLRLQGRAVESEQGREAHWYEEPLSGMRAANWATTSATRVWPTAATVHSQIPTGPAVTSTSS